MSANTRRFTTSAGIVLGVAAGAAMWVGLIMATMWAVAA